MDSAKKDLADAYQVMLGLSAWKHFEQGLRRIEEQATKDEDAVPLDELTTARIAECRGRRNAIGKIFIELRFITDGLK